MAELTGRPGFAPPEPDRSFSKSHIVALELIATLALTVALVVAATAVSLANRPSPRRDCIPPPAAHLPAPQE